MTLVDDATVGTEWGTFGIDDEGHPAQRNVLIENGVLTDLHVGPAPGAARRGGSSSGNGRRQSYRHLPWSG